MCWPPQTAVPLPALRKLRLLDIHIDARHCDAWFSQMGSLDDLFIRYAKLAPEARSWRPFFTALRELPNKFKLEIECLRMEHEDADTFNNIDLDLAAAVARMQLEESDPGHETYDPDWDRLSEAQRALARYLLKQGEWNSTLRQSFARSG